MPGIKQLGVLLVLFSSYFPLKVAWGTFILAGGNARPRLSDSPAVSILTERCNTKQKLIKEGLEERMDRG